MPESTDTRHPEAPTARRSIARKAMRWSLGLLLGLIVLLTLLAAWVSGTASGLRSVAAVVESATNGAIRLQGADGRAFDAMSVELLQVSLPDLRLEARGLRLHWSPLKLLDDQLALGLVAADTVRIATRPSDTPASGPPAGIPLPIAIRLERLELGELVMHAWADEGFGAAGFTLRDASAGLRAGPRQIEIGAARATLPWGDATVSGTMATASPFALALQATLDGELEGRRYRLSAQAGGDLLKPLLDLSADSQGVTAQARVLARPFEPVPLERVTLSAGPIDPAQFAGQAPQAALQVEADIAFAAAAPGSAPTPLDWALSGPLVVVNAAPGRWDQQRLPLQRLAGRFGWQQGRLTAEELELALPGAGTVAGSAHWQPVEGDPVGRIGLVLQLASIKLRELDARLPEATLAGRVDGEGDGAGQRLVASIAGEGLSLEATASHADQRVELTELHLRQGAASLRGTGRISLDGDQPFSATLSLSQLDPSRLHAQAPEGLLNAALELSGRLQPEPGARIDYRFEPGARLLGHELAGEGRLAGSARHLAEADLWLSLGGNRLQARGAWGQAGEQLELALEASDLALVQDELKGAAEVQASLGGTLEQPSGRLLATAARLVLPGGVRLSGLNLQGELQAGFDGPLVLAAGIGELRSADRSVLLERAGLSIEGSRSDHRIALSLDAPEGDALSAELRGTLDEAFAWAGKLTALETLGRVALRLQAPAELAASADAVRLGEARLSSAGGGELQLLRSEWRPEGLWLEGRMTGLQLGLAHAPDGEVRPLEGQLKIGGEWNLQLAEQISGTARLSRESGDLVLLGDATARLGLTDLEAVVSAEQGALAVSFHGAGSQMGRLSGSLSTHVERAGSGLRLVPGSALLGSARLDMPSIQWIGPLADANMVTGGQLTANFSVSGTPEAPLAIGQLDGKDLELSLTDVGLRLSGGTLEASFDRDYLRIIKLEFVSTNHVRPSDSRVPVARLTAEPGRFMASGGIDLTDGAGRFGFHADRLPLLQRTDRWLAVSGEGHSESGWDFVNLKARLEADAGALTIGDAPPPSLSDDVVILGDERAPGTFKVSADVEIRLGNAFYLTGMGLDTRLAGGLDVFVRPGADVVASGVIRLEDGVFEGYGQKLVAENSTVNFAGPPDNPSLNITALRKGLEVEAGVAITGTARRPRVQLVSSPSVPDSEKLAWIILGRPPDTSSSADLGLLIPAAQALLGGPGGGITSQLSNTLGLDQLSIGQGDLNSASRGATSSVVDSGVRSNAGSVSGQVVTLGKRLSTDTFLAFEQSLAGAETLVKLTHQLSKRVSVVARGGTDNAIDIFYTFSFH